jgi:methylated-DNA-[protein]-cysteine S-methyltransferase
MQAPAIITPHLGPPAEVIPVHWGRLATALGPVYVAATPDGVVSIASSVGTNDRFVAELDADLGPRAHLIAGSSPILDAAQAELAGYFAGETRTFAMPLDLRLVRGAFNLRVLAELRHVPWGHLVSYSELARRVGSPRAARAVGSACGHNPLPLVIPSHRVVHADGTIGGYGAPGIAHKRALLAIEGVVFPVTP